MRITDENIQDAIYEYVNSIDDSCGTSGWVKAPVDKWVSAVWESLIDKSGMFAGKSNCFAGKKETEARIKEQLKIILTEVYDEGEGYETEAYRELTKA